MPRSATGWADPHGLGVIAPYAGLTLSDGAERTLRTGLRWHKRHTGPRGKPRRVRRRPDERADAPRRGPFLKPDEVPRAQTRIMGLARRDDVLDRAGARDGARAVRRFSVQHSPGVVMRPGVFRVRDLFGTNHEESRVRPHDTGSSPSTDHGHEFPDMIWRI